MRKLKPITPSELLQTAATERQVLTDLYRASNEKALVFPMLPALPKASAN
jgi:hypothetical protein